LISNLQWSKYIAFGAATLHLLSYRSSWGNWSPLSHHNRWVHRISFFSHLHHNVLIRRPLQLLLFFSQFHILSLSHQRVLALLQFNRRVMQDLPLLQEVKAYFRPFDVVRGLRVPIKIAWNLRFVFGLQHRLDLRLLLADLLSLLFDYAVEADDGLLVLVNNFFLGVKRSFDCVYLLLYV